MVVIAIYVILVYDIGVERVGKACKWCRRYLTWVQNSVFEGELTQAQIEKLKAGLAKIMEKEEDSALLYIMRDAAWLERDYLGVVKNEASNIL